MWRNVCLKRKGKSVRVGTDIDQITPHAYRPQEQTPLSHWFSTRTVVWHKDCRYILYEVLYFFFCSQKFEAVDALSFTLHICRYSVSIMGLVKNESEKTQMTSSLFKQHGLKKWTRGTRFEAGTVWPWYTKQSILWWFHFHDIVLDCCWRCFCKALEQLVEFYKCISFI